MIRPSRSLHPLPTTRALIGVQLTAALVAVATCLAGPADADDVGDLVQFQPQTPARADEVNQNFADVKAAVNSKSSDGIDFATSDSSVSIVETAATPTVALSVTITAPAPGFVKADFSSYAAIGHTQNGGVSYMVCALKTDTGSVESANGRLQGSRRFVPVLSGAESGTHYPHVDTMGILSVPSAGSYTINAVCYRSSSSNSATLIYRALTATYHSDRL